MAAHKAPKPYITPELLRKLLQEFSIIYSNENREPLNLCIVGGSALQLKYGKELRDLTFDGDAYWESNNNQSIYRCIKMVSEKFNVPDDWLNGDFRVTESFSRHITQDAHKIATYGLVNIYVVSDLTQMCMKLTSFREKDSLDAIRLAKKLTKLGVLPENMDKRMMELYNGRVRVNETYAVVAKKVLAKTISSGDVKRMEKTLEKLIIAEEKRKKEAKDNEYKMLLMRRKNNR